MGAGPWIHTDWRFIWWLWPPYWWVGRAFGIETGSFCFYNFLFFKFCSSSREMRNRAEKQRRDKLNAYISELYTLVPSAAAAPRKLDKTSTLRLSANFLRIHQSKLHRRLASWKMAILLFGSWTKVWLRNSLFSFRCGFTDETVQPVERHCRPHNPWGKSSCFCRSRLDFHISESAFLPFFFVMGSCVMGLFFQWEGERETFWGLSFRLACARYVSERERGEKRAYRHRACGGHSWPKVYIYIQRERRIQ